MKDEHLPFYQYKRFLNYKDYTLTIYQNTTNSTLPRFSLSVFMGRKLIMNLMGDNERQIINDAKIKIDERE